MPTRLTSSTAYRWCASWPDWAMNRNRYHHAKHVFDHHLSLTVWAQPPPITILASPTSWHQVWERDDLSLITRLPELDVLVARTDVRIILADMHTACKVQTLLYLAISVIQSQDGPPSSPHHNSPFLLRPLKIFSKRVAVECRERHFVSHLTTRVPDAVASGTDVNIFLVDVHCHCSGLNHHRSPFLRTSFSVFPTDLPLKVCKPCRLAYPNMILITGLQKTPG